MKELYRFRQFLAEGKLLKEDNLKDYWSEWAAGEVEVGNDGVIDAGGVDADFKDVPDDTMDTFKRYVKAVKTLNASSKELRDDIAVAISGIFYDGGGFEDYEFDVLTSDQFDKIGLSEGKLFEEEKGIDYLKKAFQIYLEGGDDFNKKVGEIETVKFKNDGSLIPKNKFEAALQSLPTTVKVDVYNVNFKKVGDNIVGTFKIK